MKPSTILIVALVLVLFSCAARSVQLGDAEITLHSQQYFAGWNLTRLVYELKSAPSDPPAYWILGVGRCIGPDSIAYWLSSPFEWVDAPFRGLRYTPTRKNQKFNLFLVGEWTIGEAVAAAFFDDPGGGTLLSGPIDGATCGVASISVDVLDNTSITFPAITGPGTYRADMPMTVRVTSSAPGWTLSYDLHVDLPAGASAEAVRRAFRMEIAPHEATAGTTLVRATCELQIGEDDFGGLPHGPYVIRITFTAALPD